ncbi:MAG: response regulator [Nitrospinota bacterium]
MPLSKENFDKLFEIFKVECDEHIQKLNQGLLALENETNQPLLIEEIFREAHSLKGAARMINLSVSEKIAHHIENILVQIKKRALRLSPEITDSVLRGLDTIAVLVKKVSAGGKESDVDYTLPITLLKQVEQGFCTLDPPPDTSLPPAPAPPFAENSPPLTEDEKPLSEIDLNLFIEETNDSHDQLVKNLLKVERRPKDLNTLKTAYNNIHALKGSARLVHHTEMGDLAFSIERVLSGVIEKKITISPAVINTVLEATDIIKHFLNLIESGRKEKLPKSYYSVSAAMDALFTASFQNINTPGSQKSIASGDYFHSETFSQHKSTVRISSEKLDRIMDQTNELVIMKLKGQENLQTIQTVLDEWGNVLTTMKREKKKKRTLSQNPSQKPNPVVREKVVADKYIERVSKTVENLEDLYKTWFNDSRYLSNLIENLQYEVRKTRLLPINTITDVFPRMVRDIAASVDKKIRFEMTGTELELDKHILEEIKAPLMHLLRNSIDHGIETADERRTVGKPVEGLIKIEVLTKGKNAVIKIFDDGRGIDMNQIKEASVKAGFYTEKEISKVSEKQILNQIFHPGFSTRDTITDISGRGVGLNVVKAQIEKLNGTIDIETTPLKGTKMSLSLPTMLQTTQALKVSINENIFFLPMSNVETIINVSEKDLLNFDGYNTITFRNTNIPYNKLSTILNMEEKETAFELRKPAAILYFGNTQIAVGVDRFLGEEEILVKELGHFFKRVKNVFGITIMSNGHIAPILNIQDLMHVVKAGGHTKPQKPAKTPEKDSRKLPILVVDDSMMTRTMEKNIIESYGFDVITAVDGQDALLKLREQAFSVVVTDIQMPNMDGLELTSRIKEDERHKNMPVVLLTALESVADKKKGLMAGADAYIIKSSFDHSNLMKTIKRLI